MPGRYTISRLGLAYRRAMAGSEYCLIEEASSHGCAASGRVVPEVAPLVAQKETHPGQKVATICKALMRPWVGSMFGTVRMNHLAFSMVAISRMAVDLLTRKPYGYALHEVPVGLLGDRDGTVAE